MTARPLTRLAALLATSVVVLAGCGEDEDPEADDPRGAGTTSSAPTETPSASTGSTGSTGSPSATDGGPADTVAVPAYFVGETPIGPRLFREFRAVQSDNPVDEALALISAGDTLDPDYTTLLPGGQLTLAAGGTEKAIGINLPDLDWTERPEGMSAKEAKLAVQQIVYTVQGALQTRVPVEFFHDGLVPIFGLEAPDGFRAAKPLNVLAFVNVTAPEEGATVSGTFTASGVASSFEGTVPWEVRDEAGKAVVEGFATAEGWIDKLYPWESPVDVSGLPPGTYTFVAMTDDPSDGEGFGPTEDTKTITVE